jgi:hydrogenase maturation protein HypF
MPPIQAVARLRQLKHRPGKPLAVMALNVESVRAFCEVSAEEAAWLQRPERPIVLLQKKPQADQLMPDIAPGIAAIGVMLPYTPLQWLLFHEALGLPQHAMARASLRRIWVMTSANLSGEPIVTSNQEARERLNKVADVFLLHNRSIVTRCDDSVLAVQAASPCSTAVRVALCPTRCRWPIAGRTCWHWVLISRPPSPCCAATSLCITACGRSGPPAQLRITGTNRPASAGPHRRQPQAIACDLQPDSFSSQLAQQWSQQLGIPLLPVQHHHAHLAAVMAEQGLQGPLLGLALDGFGLGKNGGAWGGELMMLEGASCERMGHITPLPLPGGDKAARNPGAWPWGCGTGWRQICPCLPTCKIIPASPCCCASWKPGSTARTPPAWGAGSTPLPAWLASARSKASRARPRKSWKPWQATARHWWAAGRFPRPICWTSARWHASCCN